jgi:hypothetical protein
MQQREPENAVPTVAVLTAAVLTAVPFTVILVLFVIALLRCQKKDIPAIMEALAAALKALTRWGKG